jgi:hypothetical protein
MYHISVQEFKEHVRLSESWSDLVRRCGENGKEQGNTSRSCGRVLRQKVLFLNLDTQHFKYRSLQQSKEQQMKNTRAKRVWITEMHETCAAGGCGQGGEGPQQGGSVDTHEMYGTSTQEFTEFVRISHSWSDLARRCGARAKKRGDVCSKIVTVLKQKVQFLKLDTLHFTSMGNARTHVPMREADEVGEAGESGEATEASEADTSVRCGRGGQGDELTCRLINLHNNAIDGGQLRLLHGCVRGHTLEELEAYVNLWRHMGHTLEGLETYVELWRRVVDEREDYVRKYPTNVGEIG